MHKTRNDYSAFAAFAVAPFEYLNRSLVSGGVQSAQRSAVWPARPMRGIQKNIFIYKETIGAVVCLSCTLCRRYMFNVLCIIVVIMLTCVVRVNMVYLLPLQAYRPHTSTHKANCCFVYVATPVRHTHKKKLSAVVVPWISIQHITHIIMMQPHRQTHTHTRY